MVTICCTSKLLKRIGFPAESLVSNSTTALGNWYANILFFHHQQVLLFVSDYSRLAVITPAKEIRSLANQLTIHLSALLERLDAKPEWINAEIREMADLQYATTKNKRSILGTMNDYKIQIEAMIDKSKMISPIEIALNLSICPVGPLQYRNPRDVSLDLLKKGFEVG